MVTPPGAVVAPSQADLLDYYARIGSETGAPICVQDAPGATGTTMSAELLARLGREIPQIAAVKIESLPPAPKLGDVAALDHGSAVILGGAGGMDFYHELERGAQGTIPGVSMAELFVAVQGRHRAGDRDSARRLFNRYLPLIMLATRGETRFSPSSLPSSRAGASSGAQPSGARRTSSPGWRVNWPCSSRISQR